MNSAFGAGVFLYDWLSIKVIYNKNLQVVVWPTLITFKSIL
jgi:hypothetical protein